MFRKFTGRHYVDFLRDFHHRHALDWYLEIGCRTGRTLAEVSGPAIGVDPYFRLEGDILRGKPRLMLFQQESDTFFASDFLATNGIRLGMTFIDGMHLFEYALRDFMNAERNSQPGGVALIHDCYPFRTRHLTRDLDNLPAVWTGDVWKLVPILREYRPDLDIIAVDARPTGLLVVSGLDPESRVLHNHYEDILARFTTMELDDHGFDAFYDLVPIRSASEVADEGFGFARAVARDIRARAQPEVITP